MKDMQVSTQPTSRGNPTAPMVSVAMCTYNGEEFLRQQIDSILGQSRPVDEIIIADDASTDGTKLLLQEYQKRFPNLFRIYFHETNLKTVGNFQFALEQCGGEIIFLCDQDDVWHPEKVEIMLKSFRDPNCLLLFTDGRLIDPSGKPLGARLWQWFTFTRTRRFLWRWVVGVASFELLGGNKVTGATVCMRRSLLTNSVPIRVPRGKWHDQWFALHAAARDGLRFIPDLLIDYRIHPKQQLGIKKFDTSSDQPKNSPSEISYLEFVDAFKKQYPSRARWVERWEKVHEISARARSRS